MPPNQDADETVESTSARPLLARRPLLRALGAGAALTLGSGTVAATHADTTPEPNEIDPLYGYPTPDAARVPAPDADPEKVDGVIPDHVVELHVREGVAYQPGPPMDTEHGPLFHFDPTGLAVERGDVVQFTYTTPDHTITPYHPAHGFQRRVPLDGDGDPVPPFSSPVVNAGGAWLYRFDVEGLYDLYCGPHHVLGMNMRIVVGDPDKWDGGVPDYEDTFEGDPGPPPLLPPFSKEFLESELRRFSEPQENRNAEWVWLTPREVLDADALDPTNVHAEGEVTIDDVLADIDRIDASHG